MKIMGINCGRPGGNTEVLLKEALMACEAQGSEVCHTKLTSDFVESLNLSFGEVLRTTKHLGLVEKLCVEFYGLHLVICTEK